MVVIEIVFNSNNHRYRVSKTIFGYFFFVKNNLKKTLLYQAQDQWE